MGGRLRRVRGRFDRWMQIKTGPQHYAELYQGRIRAVDEEGGAKRSGSVLDLLANAAAQTG